MSSTNEKCILTGNNFEREFSLAINDLLQSDELVDVKLVTEGHLISAHRLVLSAMSPYFRKIFTQMPVNQQAFVFLKDISKQTVADLITYIYCGQVNVKQDCLDEFMNAAETLKIQGLVDSNCFQSFDSQREFTSTVAKPTFSGSVHQTSNVNHPFELTGVQYQSVQQSAQSTNYRPAMNKYQEQNGFDFGDNSLGNDGFGDNLNYDQNYDDRNSSNNSSMDGHDYQICTQWDGRLDLNENNESKTPATASASKRAKPNNDPLEYNITADVRDNGNGGQTLFHSGHKFNKHGKANAHGQQRWICTRVKSQKCRAAASTMNVNGVTMMKILMADHTHM